MLRTVPTLVLLLLAWPSGVGADGVLTFSVRDEKTGEPAVTRLEIHRADAPNRQLAVRKTVPAGIGVVLDRSIELSLKQASYAFRLIRGPEYRIVSGNFALEDSSLDEHSVDLPRIENMLAEGWTSGDCCVPKSPYSLPLRMASEDLHLAAVLGHQDARPIPGRDLSEDDPTKAARNEPSWIREDLQHHDGLVVYGKNTEPPNEERLPIEHLVDARQNDQVHVAIENPFAWPLPVWLASRQVDGLFLLGDWLRLDKQIKSVPDGRKPTGLTLGGGQDVGRWALEIYIALLETGMRIPPLAGNGDGSGKNPVGYNRLYVAGSLASDGRTVDRVESMDQWWRSAWMGRSVATNGPLMRPSLGGELPGHVFRGSTGEVLRLQPELTLAVRDPVDYLEVLHNGRVHYNARLDEFAKAGGVIPPIETKESGWVMIRVITLFEDHLRTSLSAPWYIEFDSQPRVSNEAVTFFQTWLAEYEQRLKRLSPSDIKRQAPFVRAARGFWQEKAESVTAP